MTSAYHNKETRTGFAGTSKLGNEKLNPRAEDNRVSYCSFKLSNKRVNGRILTSNPSSISQFLTQRALAVDIEVITHEPAVTDETESSAFFATGEKVVSIFTYLRVDNSFFVVLPEPLNPTSTFMLVSHVVSERALDTGGHIMPITITHCFQSKEL